MQKFFSTENFNIWIYTVSLISFFSTFAMMGQDQLLLRFTAINKNKIFIDRSSTIVIIAALILFIPISLMLFSENVMGLSAIQLAILPVLFGFCKIAYQLARSQKSFMLAQISLNGWKLALICIISFSAFLGVVNMFLLSFLCGVFVFFSLLRSMKIDKIEKTKNIFKYCVGYFLSMGTMATFVYFERFLIEGRISVNEYAEFLYFLTISLSIFTILASYFGFKEAVKYKDRFNLKILNSDLVRVSKIMVPISALWAILIYFIAPLLNMEMDTTSLFLISIIGILKCIYSILSSVMAVRMNHGEIIRININTILIFILFFFITSNFVSNITYLLIVVAALWFIRSSMILYSIRNNAEISA